MIPYREFENQALGNPGERAAASRIFEGAVVTSTPRAWRQPLTRIASTFAEKFSGRVARKPGRSRFAHNVTVERSEFVARRAVTAD